MPPDSSSLYSDDLTVMKKTCKECGTEILSNTFERTGGYCMPYNQTKQVENKIQLIKSRQRKQYVPKKEKIVYGKVYNIVACATFIAIISVIAMTYVSTVQDYQVKTLMAVRRMFFILSLFFLFHVGYSYVTGKISLRGWVLEKSKSKFHFYTGLLMYTAIPILMLWAIFVGEI